MTPEPVDDAELSPSETAQVASLDAVADQLRADARSWAMQLQELSALALRAERAGAQARRTSALEQAGSWKVGQLTAERWLAEAERFHNALPIPLECSGAGSCCRIRRARCGTARHGRLRRAGRAGDRGRGAGEMPGLDDDLTTGELRPVRRNRMAGGLASDLLEHPGRWLVAALVLDLAMYALIAGDYPEGQGRTPSLLLDLFLSWRVWRGGTKARGALILLGLLGVTLGVTVMLAELFDAPVYGGMGWPAVLCAIGSLLCLLVPALDPQERPFSR